MPLFLLKYWKPLAGILAVLLLLSGVYLKGRADANAKWSTRFAQQTIDAEKLRADLIAAYAAKAEAAAEHARRLDEVHADAQVKIAAAADSAERDYLSQLRRIANNRPRCGGGTPEALNAERLAESAARGRDRLLEEAANDLAEVGASANKLAATVKTCVAWANEVGR